MYLSSQFNNTRESPVVRVAWTHLLRCEMCGPRAFLSRLNGLTFSFIEHMLEHRLLDNEAFAYEATTHKVV